MDEAVPQKPFKYLKQRRWRLVVLLLVSAISSVFSVFVLEAPMGFDAFLWLPFLSLYSPVIGLPLILFSLWWILDRRIPLFVILIVFFSVAYCMRIWVGAPPEMTDEERRIEEKHSEEVYAEHPGMTNEEREAYRMLKEMSESSRENRNPGYKRKIFPPF